MMKRRLNDLDDPVGRNGKHTGTGIGLCIGEAGKISEGRKDGRVWPDDETRKPLAKSASPVQANARMEMPRDHMTVRAASRMVCKDERKNQMRGVDTLDSHSAGRIPSMSVMIASYQQQLDPAVSLSPDVQSIQHLR